MKYFFCLVLATFCSVACAEDITVIVPKNEMPFTASKTDIVRLSGRGIAGSKIDIAIDGPAKVVVTANVREVSGKQPIIGSFLKEFDLKPSDAGKVTATITITPPQPNAKPKVIKYEFEVK